jgi:hypothetical protein
MPNQTLTCLVQADDGYTFAANWTNNARIWLGNVGGAVNAGIRFTALNIPKGSTITLAKITLIAAQNELAGAPPVIITADDADDSAQIVNKADYDARVDTAANTPWAIPAWTQDVAYDTPSLVAIVQEIIDRPLWASGNHIHFLIKDNASANQRLAYDAGDAGKEPVLYVEWTEPGGAPVQSGSIGGVLIL